MITTYIIGCLFQGSQHRRIRLPGCCFIFSLRYEELLRSEFCTIDELRVFDDSCIPIPTDLGDNTVYHLCSSEIRTEQLLIRLPDFRIQLHLIESGLCQKLLNGFFANFTCLYNPHFPASISSTLRKSSTI